MIDILYGLGVLIIAIISVIGQALLTVLPAPVIGALVALLLMGIIYRAGWNDAVDAAYIADITKAADTRRARRR